MKSEVKAEEPKFKLVASIRHSLIFLGIVAAVAIAGYAAQQRQVAGGGLVEAHTQIIPIYVSVAVMDWLLLFFAWRGIRQRGGTFRSIIGGRWSNGREILRDLGIAAVFWGVILAASWGMRGMDVLQGQGHEKTLGILFPQTPLEVGVWIATSASAGFCEEFVFRGYVQRQLLALSRSTLIAILGQAVLFGVMHAYQGWRPVAQIIVIGVLFGVLATWRKTLRVGMIAHAWLDVWGGWLSQVILR
jgi:membrane protease YdiL (CAAX protease family)